jgi:transglutaminase-like putative cysteine protease
MTTDGTTTDGTTTDAAIEIDPAWLSPTWFLDSDDPAVGDYARRAVGELTDPTGRAVALFHAVRDGIRYDPYGIDYDPHAFRASTIASAPSGWCVTKSILLVAASRHLGIPARLGFADVRNHLTSEKLMATMGTDLFAWHGYAELLLRDPASPGRRRWFKLSTAFNIELCERFGVRVLEFDGTADALMHPFDVAGNRHMEYVRQRGSFDDLPLEQMIADFREIYGTAFGDGRAHGSAGDAGDAAFA